MNSRKDYVLSAGGSGSKFFLSFLYGDCDSRRHTIFHLHTKNPKDAPQDAQNFIYLISDPREALISFFARRLRRHERHNFLDHEGIKDPVAMAQFDPDWVIRHLRNIEGDVAAVDPTWDLADYLSKADKDAFGFESHFTNWLAATDAHTNCSRPVLFLRYEAIWKHEATLRHILQVPDDVILPPFIRRSSKWSELAPALQVQADKLLGGLVRKYEKLPDIWGKYGEFSQPLGSDLRTLFDVNS